MRYRVALAGAIAAVALWTCVTLSLWLALEMAAARGQAHALELGPNAGTSFYHQYDVTPAQPIPQRSTSPSDDE
jgi:hypothetical protein